MSADREPFNRLRVDLYRRLLGAHQEEDQRSGAHGYIVHWDDPDAFWDQADPARAWDAIGLSPVVQELFHVIETMAGENLEVIEGIPALVDPLRCPEVYLPALAASFGYRLDERLSVERKRIAVLGLIEAFKARGTFTGFKTFYRLVGFEIISIFPLWKKTVEEALGRYSRTRYATTPIVGAPLGPAGVQSFAGALADAPLRAGSLRIVAGPVTVRDDGEGKLIGPGAETGTIDYRSGDFKLVLAAPAAGPVIASFDKVTEEWPYVAARIDIEVSLSPGGAPIPLVDAEVVQGIVGRLDEVRPIHVLLRNLALVAEIVDTFTPGASDEAACVTKRLDHRDPVPSTGAPGRDFFYTLDQAVRGEDEMRYERLVAGAVTLLEHAFEERTMAICPLDALAIVAGGPAMWV